MRAKKCDEKRGEFALEEKGCVEGKRERRECLGPSLREARREAMGGMGALWTARTKDQGQGAATDASADLRSPRPCLPGGDVETPGHQAPVPARALMHLGRDERHRFNVIVV